MSTKVKNAHATTLRQKRPHQMLPNKAAATRDEHFPHGSLPNSSPTALTNCLRI
jgi:hypothetical protein